MQECNMQKPETDSKTLSAGLSPMERREKKAQHREDTWKSLRSAKSYEVSEGDQYIRRGMNMENRAGHYSWR